MPLTFHKLNDHFRGHGWAELAPATRPRLRRRPPPPAPDTRLFCRRCLTRPAAFAAYYDGQCRQCYETDPARTPCRHCKTRPALRAGSEPRAQNRYRGLCGPCYRDPAVCALYPPVSKYAHRGIGNVNRNAPLPDAPTSARPGTEAKVLVMIERAQRREQLFHPADGPT